MTTTAARTAAPAPPPAPDRRALWLAIAGAALLAAGLTAAVLAATGGRFVYATDDAYIHLRLSENIWRGTYGINPGEPAAVSSSVLFPFLLTALAPLPIHHLGPFLWGLAGAGASVVALWRLAGRIGIDRAAGPWATAALIILAALAFHVIGLPFAGLEHPLQVAAALFVLLGTIDVAEGRRAPWWLVALIVISPLIRFEGLAPSAAALAVLAARGEWRRGAVSAIGLAAALAANGAFMASLGAPMLPSSVLSKSAAAASLTDGNLSGMVLRMAVAAGQSINQRHGLLLLAFAVAGLVGAARGPLTLRRSEPLVAIAGALVAALYLAAGGTGPFYRYEPFAVAFVAIAALYVHRAAVAAFIAAAPWPARAITAAAVPVLFLPYVYATATAPMAARNIFDLHLHLHRYAVEFLQAPIAVNDLGYVSYRNPNRVLDLYGLGSERIRRLRLAGYDPAWIRAETEAAKAPVAVVFDHWFGGRLPPEWQPIGTIAARRPFVVIDGVFTVYATRPELAARERERLARFRDAVHPPAGLTVIGPAAAMPTAAAGPPRRSP
ncbi:MAG: hypothetical protein AB7O45_01460 [Alphaproteobacteria bacterium]